MVSNNTLFHSIVPNPLSHPEKINATFERIRQVSHQILAEHAPDLVLALKQAQLSVPQPRESVNNVQAQQISRCLAAVSNSSQLKQIAQLLEYAEISTDEAIELHESHKIPVSLLEKDIIPVQGQGCWIIDIDGKKYLDMDSNYSATNLGTSNQEIAQALYNQASQLISIKEDRVSIPRARFLKTFKGMLPESLNQFYWQNSGGEAVDKSLKIAKAYTQQIGVVAFKGGFHGRTHGAVSVTYNPKYRIPFGLDNNPNVHFVDYNDADAVENIFAAGKAKIVILELIQGEEGGVRPAQVEFVHKLRQICDHYEGVLICDEVQTGFGRTAQAPGQWFACQIYNIVPDIMVIGKSFGGGYPVTAVVTNIKISKAMKPGYDGSTFGGNPMAMVAATIACKQMRQLNLTQNVVNRSWQLKTGLFQLKNKYSLIGDIRISGLYIGFDLPSAEFVEPFQKLMAQNFVKTSLDTGPTIRLLPPLIISSGEIDFLLQAIDKTLATMTKTPDILELNPSVENPEILKILK